MIALVILLALFVIYIFGVGFNLLVTELSFVAELEVIDKSWVWWSWLAWILA